MPEPTTLVALAGLVSAVAVLVGNTAKLLRVLRPVRREREVPTRRDSSPRKPE